MEQKPNLSQQILQADTERLWLNYFNNRLLKEGLLTLEEYRKMQVRILQRKRNRGR